MPASTEIRIWRKTEKGNLFHASVSEKISDESMRALESIVDAAYEELSDFEEISHEKENELTSHERPPRGGLD